MKFTQSFRTRLAIRLMRTGLRIQTGRPTTRGEVRKMMITLNTAKPSPADQKFGQESVEAYRTAGNGSNRTNWSRLAQVSARVACAIRTGKSVEVTDLFADQTEAKSPAYNLAHRTLSAGLIRPEWHNVRVVALADCQSNRTTVSGTSNTTARVGSVRLFLTPAD